jgi:hypothetical protein
LRILTTLGMPSNKISSGNESMLLLLALVVLFLLLECLPWNTFLSIGPPICGLMAPDIPIHPHLPHLLLRMRGSVEGMRTARMAEYRTEEETRDRRELEDSEAMLVIDLAAGSGV